MPDKGHPSKFEVMNMRTLSLLCIILSAFLALVGRASSSSEVSDADKITSVVGNECDFDENDSIVRENPIIESDSLEDDPGISVPPFINSTINKISMNGADWSSLKKALAMSRTQPFSILHIGDSHLQADISTSTVRDLLQYDYGNAGRGLVVPFKMASTNQPWDFRISSDSKWHSDKLLRRPWKSTMRMTGIAISPLNGESNLKIATRDDIDYNPFSAFTLIHSGNIAIKSVTDNDGNQVEFSSRRVPGGTRVSINKEESGVNVYFDSENLTVNGIMLDGNRPGVFYHTVGNNGATYASYNQIPDFGYDVRMLYPDLIIISLGTNEAFGKFDKMSFISSMNRFVKTLQRANPNATILLTTPMECHKSVYTTVSKNVRKKVRGKKSRFKTVAQKSRVRSYGVNTEIREVRDAIAEYARENHIALYDWYEIAGGGGASSKWIDAGLYGQDRVHHTSRGYRLNGYLLYQALKDALSQNSENK